MSVGNTFTAAMLLSDGSTVTAPAVVDDTINSGNTEGWRTVGSNTAMPKLTLDFGGELIGKSSDVYTTKITFKTTSKSHTFNLLMVNGVQVYKYVKPAG